MASQRYRADTPATYAQALIALIGLARDSDLDFRFGPLRLADAVRSGIDVTGEDLSLVSVTLSAVSGLTPAES